MRQSRALLASLLVVAVLALGGCVRLRTDVVIRSDAHVTVSVDMGTEKKFANPTSAPCSTDPGMLPHNSTREPYDDGTYVGCRITASGPAASLGTGLSVTHDDGQFTFTFLGADPTTGNPIDPDDLSDFEVRVTFPGKALSASGQGVIDGSTVTWSDPKELSSGSALVATGEDGIGLKAYLPVLVGSVAVLLVAVVTLGAYLVGRARRDRSGRALTPLAPLPPRTMVVPPEVPAAPTSVNGSPSAPPRNPWDPDSDHTS